jgi:hypothetical protein
MCVNIFIIKIEVAMITLISVYNKPYNEFAKKPDRSNTK